MSNDPVVSVRIPRRILQCIDSQAWARHTTRTRIILDLIARKENTVTEPEQAATCTKLIPGTATDLISQAIAAGCQISITITPSDYYIDDNPEEDVQ
ncbi:hypothetical protein EMO92_06835 [Bifidobacterium reuteri]|uniref:Uncharacterized protein n=1 Tax=Bifidobacterium reuteri TaxID=983706 RepID=A0A5J5E7P5_9BIFI|nr:MULTISPECIES: hypothetical protein [Bifidobacterium]KAA8825129.1 hypothetical protein EMO92_06835 [Bifidobacterium reuteri]TPF91450.1 hypothetical protein BW10_00395 [Bifidobacterium sp. UTBIF-56]